MKPILIVTMGDPGGIGPEVVLKSLGSPDVLKKVVPVVVGAKSAFEVLAKSKINFSDISLLKRRLIKPGNCYFFDISGRAQGMLLEHDFPLSSEPRFLSGKVSPVNAALAMASLEAAADACSAGEADGMVTAPVNKTAMRLLDPRFHGHTEYLADKTGVRKFAMMFVSPRLCVTLATVHVALKDVSKSLTRAGVFEKIILTDQFLKSRLGKKRPRIAVCALNPHGEETGTEEASIIRPAVNQARKAGVDVSGPFAADQLFYEAYEGHYDALVSMYHDQALAPFKMVSFHDGVNVTAGLPFVRTSPDHGTAFDIAGRGKAQSASMTAAILLAARLAKR